MSQTGLILSKKLQAHADVTPILSGPRPVAAPAHGPKIRWIIIMSGVRLTRHTQP